MLVDHIKDKSKVIYVGEFKIVPTDIVNKTTGISKEILKHYKNWVLFKNKLHYFKIPNSHQFALKELVGVKISEHFGLDTIKHKLARTSLKGHFNNSDLYGLLSENFRDPRYEYLFPDELIGNEQDNKINEIDRLYELKNHTFSEENFYSLSLSIINMALQDFSIMEIDRYASRNILLKRKKRELSLAPIFDYDCSFENIWEEPTLDNYFISMPINESNLAMLFNRYPESYDKFKSILDIDMEKILADISEESGLKVYSWNKEIFMDTIDDRKSVVKEYLKKL